MAAVEFERVFYFIQAFTGRLIAAVYDPAIGVQQRSRSEISVAIPPVAGATG